MTFLEKNKTIILVIGMMVIMFFVGRYSKPSPPADLGDIIRTGDSLRAVNRRLVEGQVVEAAMRDSMQKEISARLSEYDSLLLRDSLALVWYKNQLTKKRTPNEIEAAMVAVYNQSVR